MVIRGINFDRSRYCPYYAPAMVHLLADRLQPMELANRCKVIEFKMTIGDCGRIAEIVEKELAGLERKDQPIDWKAAPVEGKLEFSAGYPMEWVELGYANISGKEEFKPNHYQFPDQRK